MDEKKVANEEVKETPTVQPTPPPQTEKPTSEVVGADVKQEPVEVSDRFDKHPRFQELNQRVKDAETKAKELEVQLQTQQLQEVQEPPVVTDDPYSKLSPEEKKQTEAFIDQFVMPKVRQAVQPYEQRIQVDMVNKQIEEAKTFAGKYGINFEEKLPEVIDYLKRPGNQGRLTAVEAVRNLYFNEMTNAVKTQSLTEAEREQQELNQKKKEANMQVSSVSPGAVVHSDEARRSKMNEGEKLMDSIRYGMEMAKKGERHPKVRGD